jgi:hypothetical protein
VSKRFLGCVLFLFLAAAPIKADAESSWVFFDVIRVNPDQYGFMAGPQHQAEGTIYTVDCDEQAAGLRHVGVNTDSGYIMFTDTHAKCPYTKVVVEGVRIY